MMCKHFCLVLITYFISDVFTSELVFESCSNNGWTCSNNTNNEIDVAYNCPQDVQANHSVILWEFGGLPSLVQSVTIMNCDASLTVKIKTIDVATKKFPHLRGFVVKNVTELIINEATFSIPEILQGIALVKFENIKRITSLDKNTIGGNNFDSLKSITFEMNDVQINTIQNRAVWWTEYEIPFKMFWKNVKANVIAENALHISDTKSNPNTQVFINDCKFGEIKKKSFNIHSTEFSFKNNEVTTVDKSAFRIQSNRTDISKNNFHHISNFAFLFVNIGLEEINFKFESNTVHEAEKLSMNFGAPHFNELQGKVSFRNNKFNCLNSTWLQRSDDEKIENTGGEEEEVQYPKYLKKIEKIITDNNENVCINLPCSISLSKFKDTFKKNGPNTDYCQTKSA